MARYGGFGVSEVMAERGKRQQRKPKARAGGRVNPAPTRINGENPRLERPVVNPGPYEEMADGARDFEFQI